MRFLPILLLSLLGSLALADPPPRDEVARQLFPPELVLKYSQEIGLDDRQSKELKALVQQAQSRFLDLQWDLQSEQGKLIEQLRQRPVNENATLAQLDRVLALEHDIKTAQLLLLIRIKNDLSEAQQQKLTALRDNGSS
jgi:hypothetical protein